MKLKEIIQREKELMSSFRWKLNYRIIPIFLVSWLLPLLAMIPLMSIDEERYTPLFIGVMIWVGLVFVGMIAMLPWITKKETQIELERYNFLFKDPKILEEDKIIVPDEELVYTLDKEGVYMEIPAESEGQVFDENKENLFYIPWDRGEFALATQAHLHRVYIALAVFSLDREMLPFFIPLTEESYALIKSVGIDKQLGGEWAYLFYNPEDAFKQILAKGRIVTMRNKKTGKAFVDAQGNFIGNEE